MKEIILKTNNLTKKYKDFVALDKINIEIDKGDIYGLIGRNGAGKTTLMKIITTLSNKTSGGFTLFNHNDNDLNFLQLTASQLSTGPIYILTHFPSNSNINFVFFKFIFECFYLFMSASYIITFLYGIDRD